MKKRLVKCGIGWGVTNSGVHNIQVFYCYNGYGYHFELFICMNCGEIFVVDCENLFFRKKTLQQIVQDIKCPMCSCTLSESLQEYPSTFRTKNGDIGHFTPERLPPIESILIDFFEIK